MMFQTDEDKFLYLVGCALNGTAAAPADICKITRQAYGIAEEMLVLINKLKQTAEYRKDAADHTSSNDGEADKISNSANVEEPKTKHLTDSNDLKNLKDVKDVKNLKPSTPKSDLADKTVKTTVLPMPTLKKAANLLNSSVAAAKEDISLEEQLIVEELAKTYDKGWNYTPWGKS